MSPPMNYPIYHISSPINTDQQTNGAKAFAECLPEKRRGDLVCITMPNAKMEHARIQGVAHALMSFVATGAKLCLVTFGKVLPELLFSDISTELELHNGSKSEADRFEYVSLCGFADDPGPENLFYGVKPEWLIPQRDLSPRLLRVNAVSGPRCAFAVTHQGACKLLAKIYPRQLMRTWEQTVQSALGLVQYQCNVPFFCGPKSVDSKEPVAQLNNLQQVANQVAGNVKEDDKCNTPPEWPDLIGAAVCAPKPLGIFTGFGIWPKIDTKAVDQAKKNKRMPCPACSFNQECPEGSTALRCKNCGGHWLIEAWNAYAKKLADRNDAIASLAKLADITKTGSLSAELTIEEQRTLAQKNHELNKQVSALEAKSKASAELEKIYKGVADTIKESLEADLRARYQIAVDAKQIAKGRLQKARCCPICGSTENPYPSPRTQYLCGTTTCDDRPGTFRVAARCLQLSSQQLGSAVPQSTEEASSK